MARSSSYPSSYPRALGGLNSMLILGSCWRNWQPNCDRTVTTVVSTAESYGSSIAAVSIQRRSPTSWKTWTQRIRLSPRRNTSTSFACDATVRIISLCCSPTTISRKWQWMTSWIQPERRETNGDAGRRGERKMESRAVRMRKRRERKMRIRLPWRTKRRGSARERRSMRPLLS